MTQVRRCATVLSFCFTALLGMPGAYAASLQKVEGWATGAVPNDVSMYQYVPDAVVDNPPILVLIHYCGGTADAVFGQARGGGLVAAADEHGFVMVVPSSGRCWDIVSDKTRTRDAGGDSHAIRMMVSHAVNSLGANAERVYATGDSSGGMMTELLLGVYPDVFKAGAALAGMPAGCRGANESGSGGGYSGACAGGMVTHTPEEWGTIARSLAPNYDGHRPRVQLFHGDGDTTIVYKNHTEAIKEWTNVLGLSADPSTTDNGVQLGQHQATRLRWQNDCGFVVLDAFTSIGGDHGPSDALFLAEYIVPFLGLDHAGPLDPEIEECEAGGPSQPDAGAAPTSSAAPSASMPPLSSATASMSGGVTPPPSAEPSAAPTSPAPSATTGAPSASVAASVTASAPGSSPSVAPPPAASASAIASSSAAPMSSGPLDANEAELTRDTTCALSAGTARSRSAGWSLLAAAITAAGLRRRART